MSAGVVPKQGDHVFNDVATAIMRPFQTIKSLRSEFIEGQLFIHRYLLQSYSAAKRLSENPGLAKVRVLAASLGDEEQAFREFSKLSLRQPQLRRITPSFLKDIHSQNASEFGHAADRFHFAFFTQLQRSLESAIAPSTGGAVAAYSDLGLAYQGMLNAAYDPASALVLITDSMSRETPPSQGAFNTIILGIADTLHRPGMWKEPYAAFHEDRPSATKNIVTCIGNGLAQLDFLKAPGQTLAYRISQEVVQHKTSQVALSDFGAMLHLVQTKIQRRHEA